MKGKGKDRQPVHFFHHFYSEATFSSFLSDNFTFVIIVVFVFVCSYELPNQNPIGFVSAFSASSTSQKVVPFLYRNHKGFKRRFMTMPMELNSKKDDSTILNAASQNEPKADTSSINNKNTDSPVVVILGGGIIGSSTAYYLTRRGIKPIVIERAQIAAAASGKAGGFLAKNWGNAITEPLHLASYNLHEELAKELNLSSYRKLPTMSVNFNGKGKKNKKNKNASPYPRSISWIDGETAQYSLMDNETAQITPYEFTTRIWEEAEKNGAELIIGAVKSVESNHNNLESDTNINRKIVSIQLEDGREISNIDEVIIAMGPWSVQSEEWFQDVNFNLPMEGIKSTSIVVPQGTITLQEPAALFCDEDENGCHLEVYPRPITGEVYMCGLGGSDYVSGGRLKPGGDCDCPEKIEANPLRKSAAARSFRAISESLGSIPEKDIYSQACMRPCPNDGLPVIGPLSAFTNVYFNCGQNCWGILWGPISGKIMSELITDGEISCVPMKSMKSFTPDRFSPSLICTKKQVISSTDTSGSHKIHENMLEGEELSIETKETRNRGRKQKDKNVGEQW